MSEGVRGALAELTGTFSLEREFARARQALIDGFATLRDLPMMTDAAGVPHVCIGIIEFVVGEPVRCWWVCSIINPGDGDLAVLLYDDRGYLATHSLQAISRGCIIHTSPDDIRRIGAPPGWTVS